MPPKFVQRFKPGYQPNNKELEWLANNMSFEEVEKILGITEISMDGMRYPISKYYRIVVPESSLNFFERIFKIKYFPGIGCYNVVTDKQLEKRHKFVQKFLANFFQKT